MENHKNSWLTIPEARFLVKMYELRPFNTWFCVTDVAAQFDVSSSTSYAFFNRLVWKLHHSRLKGMWLPFNDETKKMFSEETGREFPENSRIRRYCIYVNKEEVDAICREIEIVENKEFVLEMGIEPRDRRVGFGDFVKNDVKNENDGPLLDGDEKNE